MLCAYRKSKRKELKLRNYSVRSLASSARKAFGTCRVLMGWYAMVLCVAVLTSCGSANKQERLLAVSIEPLRYFTNAIAEGRWQSFAVVPAGYSPEEYAPTARQMVRMSQSAALLRVGNLGFERTWLSEEVAAELQMREYDLSVGVNTIATDPHTWTSPRNAKQISRNICAALAELDPQHRSDYEAATERLVLSLDSLDAALREMLASLPSRTFVIAHPALTQFAHDYGLTQLAIEQDGKEPSARDMQQMVEKARSERVKVVFVQKEFPDQAAQMVAEQIGARIVGINPLSADWKNELLFIAKSLKNGK